MKAFDICTINFQICWYSYAISEVILENKATVIILLHFCTSNKSKALVQMQKIIHTKCQLKLE